MPDSSVAATKNCPQCRALLAADTAACACGYRFTAQEPALRSSADLITKAEEIFETHLRARLAHALRQQKFAKIDVLRDPRNTAKITRLRDAERDLRLLEEQLEVQRARTAAARAAAQQAPAAPAAPVTPAVTEAFREVQAVKAKEAFDFARAQLMAEQAENKQSTGMFANTQAGKAEQIAATPTRRLCPGCGTVVSAQAQRCECGYKLAADETDGDDFITAEEKAALRKSP